MSPSVTATLRWLLAPLGLGLVLIFAPAAMSRLVVAVGLLAAALAVTGTCVWIERRRARRSEPRPR